MLKRSLCSGKLNQWRPCPVLPLISGITFLSFLDINLLIPVMALYAAQLGATTAVIGLIVGMYSVINTPANLVSGRLIDRFGYKAPLLTGLFISAVSMFSYSLTRLPVHLALVRAIHGLGGGLTSPATMSAITEHAGETQRGRAMGFYGMAIALANLVGFALSGLITSRLGYRELFWFGTIMLVLGIALSLLLPGVGGRGSGAGGVRHGLRQIKTLWQRKGLAVSYATIFAQYFTFGGLVTLLPLYVRSLGMDAFHVGMMLTAFTVMFIVMQYPGGVISDRLGRIRLVALGLGLGIISLVILPRLTTFPPLVAAMSLFGVAFGILFPSASALVGDYSTPGERGMATGIFHALLTAGVAVGAITIGWTGEVAGIRQGLQLAPAVMSLVLVLIVAARRRCWARSR